MGVLQLRSVATNSRSPSNLHLNRLNRRIRLPTKAVSAAAATTSATAGRAF
jgi:hypothetical protein